MSVELIVNPDADGEGDGFELAPNHAWRTFAAWAIDARSDYPALAALASQSVTPDAASVASEAAKAVESGNLGVDVEAVAAGIRDLAASLGSGDSLLVD